MTPVDKLVAKVRGHFAPPARINVAEWADLYREIPRGTSAEPGRWRNSRLPYLTEIMESFTDPTASEIILEIARQMGKTECIINAICFFADVDPCNILVKYPTQDSARKFSQKKLAPVIRETPRLKNKFQDPRSRDSGNTIFNKPIDISTPIFTLSGWVRFGDLKVGDFVFDDCSNPTRVTHLTPTFIKSECYTVKFSDGESITCDADHLWPVSEWKVDKSGAKPKQIIVESAEITSEMAGRVKKDNRFRFFQEMPRAIEMPKSTQLIDPYVLGVWLGDGFSHAGKICGERSDLIEIIETIKSKGYEVDVCTEKDNTLTCLLDRSLSRQKTVGFRNQLKYLGLLGKIGKSQKHVPLDYVFASVEQRYELIRGLMDTDGTISKTGACVFVNTNRQIADSFGAILASLGIKFSTKTMETFCHSKTHAYDKSGKPAHYFYFRSSSLPVFKLRRKLKRWMECGHGSQDSRRRRIVSIEKTPSVPVKCITVESESHSFLIGKKFVKTHNCFPGGSITLIGANSSSGTRAVSCRVVIQDEIDSDQPNSEGDPIEQADGRAENFHDAVKIKLSTPTRKPIDDGKGNKTGSRIQILYDDSDQRQWHCPCPKCGLWQPLHWRNVKWTWTQPDGEIISDPERAVYVCDGCAVELSDFDRVRMVMAGKWIAKNPHSMRRGYHLSGLYRIMGKKRAYKSYLHEFVARFLDAKHQGPEVMRVWVNTFLAECYEETIEKLDVNPIYNRRETYGPVLPKKVLVLTCQVDVQGDRLECMIKGWGLGHESWGIQFKRIMGNPFKREVWAALDEFISQQFDHPTLGKLSIPITLIDSGGQANDQGFADEVYRYVRTRQPNETGPGVYAIKGSSSSSAPLVSSRRPKTGICLKVIGTGNAKTTIHARLKLEQPGPRFMHYNLDGGFDEEYFAQLGAEAPKVVKKKGYTFTEWHKIRTRNEAFDLEVYSLAAIEILNPDLPSIAMRSKASDTEPEEKPAEVAKPKTYRLRKPPARTQFAPRFQPRFRR